MNLTGAEQRQVGLWLKSDDAGMCECVYRKGDRIEFSCYAGADFETIDGLTLTAPFEEIITLKREVKE
ncbi:MAG: hypothetical protein R3B90_11380 [Planctomycetaceae bacterium]